MFDIYIAQRIYICEHGDLIHENKSRIKEKNVSEIIFEKVSLRNDNWINGLAMSRFVVLRLPFDIRRKAPEGFD